MVQEFHPKRFVNGKDSVVQEAIDGLLVSNSAHLVRLDTFPHTKVVLRKTIDKTKVALVSEHLNISVGGGSGHEPAHAGFVGEGLLTAAVCGEIFASPTVDAVLSAIVASTGSGGCLLIVKNYTGDRLNFGLAAEKAKSEYGLKVRMVIIGDDVALGPPFKNARGVAGTLFIHKIAGAMAEQGKSLDEIYNTVQKCVTDSVKSMGVSFSTCTQPFADSKKDDDPNIMELGLGIHGEPGKSKDKVAASKTIVEKVCHEIAPHIKGDAGNSMAVLINNLGGVPPLEMSIVAKDTLSCLQNTYPSKKLYLVGPAPLMTSLDMNGISISLLPITNDETLDLLSAPVAPHTAWPTIQEFGVVSHLPSPLKKEANEAASSAGENPAIQKILKAACDALINNEADLNAMDSKVGDGDTGTQMSLGAKSLLADAKGSANLSVFCQSMSSSLSKNMGGSSAMSTSLKGDEDISKAFEDGIRAMQEYGGAELNDRTMLDALIPASKQPTLEAAVSAAKDGAERTKTMKKANAGRSMYVNEENLDGCIDPGAAAVAIALEAMLNASS